MNVDFAKGDGLVPAIIQDSRNGAVLMLGYMNQESLAQTRESGWVTFYSRSRKRLWTKGEESGHRLQLENILPDCDGDTLLVTAKPEGPVCHTGQRTCFSDEPCSGFGPRLESVLRKRRDVGDPEKSYAAQLFSQGRNKIAQKVGEEATEFVIEAVNGPDDLLLEEAADLHFHLLVALVERGLAWDDVVRVLERRERR